MDGRILSTAFAAATGLGLLAAAPAHAACPERIDLLKQFVEEGTFDEATKAEIDQLSLDAVASEEACERTVAELERRLNVEVREDEVVRIGGDGGSGSAAATTGGESGTRQDTGQTAASGDQQPASGEEATTAAAGTDTGDTIGGGLDMPRDQIDAKYGPLAWLTFDEVIGAEVLDAEGDPIAEVSALVRDLSTGEFFAVLDPGMGAQVVTPINQLEVADRGIAMGENAGDIDSMPEYDAGRYEDVRE